MRMSILRPGLRPTDPPPFHELDSLVFEELCRDLFDTELLIATCEIYGDPGQTQDGIDLIAHRRGGDGLEVGQCKCYGDFPPADIRAVSDKFFEYWETHWVNENIKRFILFVATDLKTRQRQDEIIKQKKRFAKYGIEYEAWSATKIRNKLRSQPVIVATYCHPPDYWVPLVCGTAPPPIPSFVTPTSSTIAADFFISQIEKFSELVSNETELRLEVIREWWREGQKSIVLQEITQLRNNQEKWSVLSQETKAKLLCFEGSIELDITGKTEHPKQLAEQAAILAQTSNEARLRSLIAFRENKPEEAIQYLSTWDDIDSVNLRIALSLDIGDVQQCQSLLNLEIVANDPTAETFRVRALFFLITKELNKAQLEIQKAIEIKPKWESIKFAEALIHYYSALSVDAFPTPMPISTDPVDWMYIRRDDQSLARLRKASELFQELATLSEKIENVKQNLQIWQLASLANDPEKQEVAANYCYSLLEKDPSNVAAIMWAIARSYEFQIEVSISVLERQIVSDIPPIYQILGLLNCYFVINKPKEAFDLLERTKPNFSDQQADEAWAIALAQAHIVNNTPEAVLKLFERGDTDLYHRAKLLTFSAIGRKTGDWSQFDDFLKRTYEKTKSPDLLLTRCELKAQQQDWQYVADHIDALLHHFETTDVFRLVVVAIFKTENYRRCIQLLDNYRQLFPFSKLPNDLRRMRVICLHELGTLPEAIYEAEALAKDEPTIGHLITLANLYATKGDLKSVVLVCRRLSEKPDLPAEQALRFSRLLLWEDPQLATSLWKKSFVLELSDELVGEAFFLGGQLGIDSEFLKPLFERLHKLGVENRGGIHFGPASEITEIFKQARAHSARLDELYRTAKAPIHLVSQEGNLSLVIFYRNRLLENERRPDPNQKIPLLARFGGRMPMDGFPETVSKLNFHLDITSVLLAKHLEILPPIERAFAPLFLPPDLVPALLQMRERLVPHQPPRLQRLQQIIDFADQGLIRLIEQEATSETKDQILLADMGLEWVTLLDLAQINSGYLVDFLPLTKNDLSGDSPTSLPENIEQHLINCRAIVESLRQQGPLSNDEFYRALENMGSEGQVSPSKTIPSQGANLYCEAAVPETLASANLLFLVCSRFRLFINKRTYDTIRNELASNRQMNTLAVWVDELISHLNSGIDEGVYRVAYISPERRKLFTEFRPDQHLGGCLAALLGFEIKKGDIIWSDDRWLNSHQHRDGIPIADIYDILKLLVSSGELSEPEYYQILIRLRTANVIFIPIQRDEIVYHLKQAQIDTEQGKLIETQQLKILRQYASSCLLRQEVLQIPPMPEGSPNEHGESAFIINLMRAVAWALFDVWSDESADESVKYRQCEWIIQNLYVEYLTLSYSTSLISADDDKNFRATLGIIALLSAPFSSTMKEFDREKATSKDFYDWVYQRILRTRFSVDPHLLTGAVERLKQSFEGVKREAKKQKSGLFGANLLMEHFYDNLPEPIQAELRKDENFMAEFGIEFIRGIMIGGLSFRPDDFYLAAQEAINGRTVKVNTIRDEYVIEFKPVEDELALHFIHPITGENLRVIDKSFALFNDSSSEREAILLRHRNWFDCPDVELKQVIAEIASTENLIQRVSLVESWKEGSAQVFYENLYHQIKKDQKINFQNLLPPDGARLLQHYRLSADIAFESGFSDSITIASRTLIHEEGLWETIHRLVGFPTPLPIPILDAIDRLSDIDKTTLIKKMLQAAGSPLSTIHFLHILIRLGKDKPVYYRLARRLIKKQFSENAIKNYQAFSVLLKWANVEMGYWQAAHSWPSHIRLAMVWAHAHQIFTVLIANGAPVEWISENFSLLTSRLSPDMFDRDLGFWLDVAYPNQVNALLFTYMGLAYAIGQEMDNVTDPEMETLLYANAFSENNGVVLPLPPLLRDVSRASNSLDSFLAGSYADNLLDIFGSNIMMYLSPSSFQKWVDQAITNLNDTPDDLSSWVLLSTVVGEWKPYEFIEEKLENLLNRVQIINIYRDAPKIGLTTLEFSSLQAIHLKNRTLVDHLKSQLQLLFGYLATEEWQDVTTQDQEISLEPVCLRLAEVALNLAISYGDTSQIVQEFSGILTKLIETWPATIPVVRNIVQILCDELSVEQGQYFGKLLIRLRAE